jgi:hypothetical protein
LINNKLELRANDVKKLDEKAKENEKETKTDKTGADNTAAKTDSGK